MAERLLLPQVLYCIDSSSQTAEEDIITVMTCGDTEVGKARVLPVPGRRKTCAGWGDGEEREAGSPERVGVVPREDAPGTGSKPPGKLQKEV